MAIVLPDSQLTDAQIERLRLEFRDSVNEILTAIHEGAYGTAVVGRLLTARELGHQLLALLDLVGSPSATREIRIAAVNVGYEGFIAMIDIAKSQAGRPMVPVHRSAD